MVTVLQTARQSAIHWAIATSFADVVTVAPPFEEAAIALPALNLVQRHADRSQCRQSRNGTAGCQHRMPVALLSDKVSPVAANLCEVAQSSTGCRGRGRAFQDWVCRGHTMEGYKAVLSQLLMAALLKRVGPD